MSTIEQLNSFVNVAKPGDSFTYYNSQEERSQRVFNFARDLHDGGSFMLTQKLVEAPRRKTKSHDYIITMLSLGVIQHRLQVADKPAYNDFDFKSMGGKVVSAEALFMHMDSYRRSRRYAK